MIFQQFNFKDLSKKAGSCILDVFTRDQLRELAKEFGIPRGKNKADTINNLELFQHKIDRIVTVEIYQSPIK